MANVTETLGEVLPHFHAETHGTEQRVQNCSAKERNWTLFILLKVLKYRKLTLS